MDSDDRFQPSSQSFVPLFNTQATPQMIEPCATVLNEDGYKVPAVFHLLSCGHVVGIDAADQRCGRNCQHAVTTIARLLVQSNIQTPSATGYYVLEETTSQALDILYCEICNGIPVERYQLMHLEPEGGPSTIRRVLAVRRSILHVLPGFSSMHTDELFCFPYFSSTVGKCDGQYVHKLRCGHAVWSPLARSCAANCVDWPSGPGATTVTWERLGDAILCHECEGRAEQVYRRYAQQGLTMRKLTMRDILG